MLDGTLCESCGSIIMDGEEPAGAVGYPRYCEDCRPKQTKKPKKTKKAKKANTI